MGGSSSNSQPKDCHWMDILLTFHQFLLLVTSIFAIPSNVFEGFAIFTIITSKPLSNCLRTSKSTPTGLQNDSRSLPRRYQDDPKVVPRAPWATLGLVWNTCGWLFIKFSTKRLPLDRYLAYFSEFSAPQNLHFCNTFKCF